MNPILATMHLYRLICDVFDISPNRPIYAVEDFISKCWDQWTKWAKQYLADHPSFRKIYLNAMEIAAAVTRAFNRGLKFVRINILGDEDNTPQPRVVSIESVPLENASSLQARAETNPVLAIRY